MAKSCQLQVPLVCQPPSWPACWVDRLNPQRGGGIRARQSIHLLEAQRLYKAWWLPNMSLLGLAMVVPASISITMFLGSLVAALVAR